LIELPAVQPVPMAVVPRSSTQTASAIPLPSPGAKAASKAKA
jgi:hypothetical protein